MRPTQFGTKALVFVAVVWLSFLATPYSNLFFLWLCLFLALAIVATVSGLANLRGLRAELADSGPIPAGTPTDLRLFVSAGPRGARDLRVELRIGSRKIVAPLRGEVRGDQELGVTIPELPRGVHRLTRVSLTSAAPFGLLRARRRVKAPAEIVVHAQPLAVEQSSLFASLGVDREAQVIGLRAFREGDDPREIHSRASARRNALVVRERDVRGSEGVFVVLDRRAAAGDLERGLSAVAGLCELAARHGGALRLSTQGLEAEFAREGRDGKRPLRELLDWLARAAQAPPDAAPPADARGAVDAHALAAEIAPLQERPPRPAPARRERSAAVAPARALLALVLLDLGFVAITDAVGVTQLVLLVLATLATPFLVRWHATVAWRVTWNLAVLVLFTLLLRDVLESSVERLLEDGLLLAAFCQVHLVNNLLRTQKPDLLILNSAMIGIVTAFFCHDLAYSPLFAAYVLTVCWALAPGRGTVLRAVATLLIAFAAFVGLPRDFERPGFAMDALRTMQGRIEGEDAVHERLPLAREQRAVLSDVVAVRATVLAGQPGHGPLYLRMNTYVGIDLNGWQLLPRQHGSSPLDDEPWVVISPGEWARPAAASTCTLRLEQARHQLARLLAPLRAARIVVLGEEAPIRASVIADGTIRFVPGPAGQDLTYEVELGEEESKKRGGTTLVTKDLKPYLAPGPLSLLDGLNELSSRCRADVFRRDPQHVVVEKVRSALSVARTYALPGEKGGARSLAEFVARECGGHCEYFASTLAILLRLSGIPCRLVTGFLADEWDETRTRLVVREKHAHAWVEVYDPEGGWYTVDATPGRDGAEAGEGALAAALDHARTLWSKVTGFTKESRAELARAALSWPSLAACAALVLVFWARRRRASEPPCVRRYRRALAAARVVPRPAETPRETLARARAGDMDARRLALLEAATAQHERERYE